MARAPRIQRHFGFVLDAYKRDEREISAALYDAKEKREMHKMIRDALRLYIALSRGDIETLAEMFPRSFAKLTVYYRLNSPN